MINYKYGEYPDSQVQNYKKKLHSLIHWLLIYSEENPAVLDNYFDTVQRRLDSYNKLMNYPDQMIEIMNLVEMAHTEFSEKDSHSIYRRTILDIHSLIDKLPPNDGGEVNE